MPKTKISEYSATANSNTDVASINIDEGCAPSGINNAIRAIMGHLKDFQSGTSNDPFTVGSSGSLTLSYGTANGVAYLNGSKVLTTGSALVFDGTNLGVGTTSSLSVADKLTVVGGNFAVQRTSGITTFMGDNTADGYAGTATNHAFALLTNSTERARITSGGDLLVGDTSAYSGSRLSVKTGNNNGTTHAWYAKNSSATVLGYQRDDGLFNTGAATNSPYNFTTASAANLFVDSSGTFYRSTSSLKYKTDVQDATHGLAEVLSLRPVTYRGKNDGETIFGGLIAEEVDAAGLTEFVQYAEDGTPDALAYGNMVSLCIKAIQEQQAIITQLQADVAALKGASA